MSRYAVYFFGILSSSNINTPVARIFCYIYRCVMCSTVWWRQCEADVAVMDGALPIPPANIGFLVHNTRSHTAANLF